VAYQDLSTRNDVSSLTGEGKYDPNPEGAKATFQLLRVFAEFVLIPNLGSCV